ncbi:MAG TPA: response regulator [Candidatus Binataceae bacterium]|nr:response regulator [Candidatus Binataceae bacterium]
MATRHHLAPVGGAKIARTRALTGSPPALVVLSEDDSIRALAAEATPPDWRVERHDGSVSGRELLNLLNIRIVILDDDKIEPGDRGWLLGRIRHAAPQAPILYVAEHHDSETERQARAGGAQYYCAKPIDRTVFIQVLGSFLRAAK